MKYIQSVCVWQEEIAMKNYLVKLDIIIHHLTSVISTCNLEI